MQSDIIYETYRKGVGGGVGGLTQEQVHQENYQSDRYSVKKFCQE